LSDPWTDAWAEAEATAPPGLVVYDTIELQHTSFAEPVRVVNAAEDQTLTLEAGADPDGGSAVVFTAIPFSADKPEYAEGRVPQCTVTIDNVARELVEPLEAAVQYRADLYAIFRQFRSDDTTEPCYGPVEFVIKKVTVSGTRVQGVAILDNLSNKRFPTRNYTINEFPGLAPNG
jgi:Domain of unknown function (DUF1833)